jgi:ribonuclease III
VSSRLRWAAEHLQYSFTNANLLEWALTHRSASTRNNERLEFLGDAFLNFIVADRLYAMRPEDSEGDLSRSRAALVKQATLAQLGLELGVDAQVILGPGELRSGGSRRNAVLADTVEALIGAVLLDGGHKAAQALVERLYARRFEELPASASLKDAKTKLQEWLQGRGHKLPIYKVEQVHGRDHEQTFTVVCEVEEKHARTLGEGKSRRRAEQEAAAAMLAVLTSEHGE